ncbi:thioredoxin domain-containing protein [Chryseobacterium indoltheticum]|uniref:thioredoxin domain-containing protein n=1 Tax=Chryseobacterium indoltheticum TaxID=254 RepID=UPI003F49828E
MHKKKKASIFKNVNLEAAKKIAQKENKLIFIDLFTTWCGPCKLMKKIHLTMKKSENFSIKTL